MKTIKTKLLFTGIIVFVIVVVTAALWLLLTPPPLIIQGEVEATQIDIASKISGRVETIHVQKGASVTKGQLLATIDSPEIRAKLKQATAALAAATAQKNKAYRGTREETTKSAYSMWEKARAATALAEKTYNRIDRLFADGVIPAQKRDEAAAQLTIARKTENAARAAYDMAQTGPREEDRQSAASLAEQASGTLEEAEAYSSETTLTAPINGEVTDIIVDPGELISPGFPVISLIDLNDIWVTFNLREDLLANIQMGSLITARFPALGTKEIKLKIQFISALGDFATWRATKASGDFDLKTFEIHAVPVRPVLGLRAGMSAIVDWNTVATEPRHE